MNYSKLILSCITCIKTYNSNIETPDSHVENYLKTLTKDSNERMFIKQVFYGVLQYSNFLKVFTNKLFEMNISSTERKDEFLYQIFLYITLFRLVELPLDEYKQLIVSQDSMKMNEFFKFIFDFENVEKNLRPQWIEILDYMFVDDKLLYNLRINKGLLTDLISSISKKAIGIMNMSNEEVKVKQVTTEKIPKKITIPEPFKLTEVKPRKLKEPIKLEHKINFKPIPYNQFQKTNLEKIEEDHLNNKIKNYEEVISKYDPNNEFKFETDKRPMNKDKIREEIEKRIESELKFNQKYVNKPIDYSSFSADVKYNEAAIYREEFLIKQKLKKEEEDIEKIIIEKKDAKEFERWKREMIEKDDIIKQEEILKRKMLNEMSKEVAVNHQHLKIKENQMKVKIHKEIEDIKFKEKEAQLAIELDEKRKLVKEVDRERENIIAKKEEVQKKNKETYDNQIQDYKELMNKVKAEKQIEEERRKDIIRQIRELEKLPVKRTKGFDPSETPGYGLLEEMSLVELRERLQQQKLFHQEMLDAKKETNKIKAEEKVDSLVEKAKTISQYRDKLRNKKQVQRKDKIDKIAEAERIKQEIHEKNLLEVKEKIEKKKKKLKKDEEEFQIKIREIQLQQQYLKLGKAAVEEKAFKQIEEGLERKINNRQNSDLINQQVRESLKVSFIY